MRIHLALGSNIGPREDYLRAGIHGLANRGIHVIHCASLYSTEPRDFLDQPWFLNIVIEADTFLTPDELLSACLEVEKENGRMPDTKKGPRTLDIDIIFYGNEIVRRPGLTIPHPSFSSRRFVLVPLAEIAPEMTDPVTGTTITELLKFCPDTGDVLLAGTLEQFP